MMTRRTLVRRLLSFGLFLGTSTAALAWGATGHEWVSGIHHEEDSCVLRRRVREAQPVAFGGGR